MSDGISDANALGHLGVAVERAAGELARAMYHARIGHRGLSVDELETANEVLALYGLRLISESDYADRIGMAGKVLRW